MRLRSFLLFLFLGVCFNASAQDTLHVYFPLNASILTQTEQKKIDNVIHIKHSYPEVLIYGYTDRTGTKALNDTLSVARANRVKNYLAQNGVNVKNIKLCIGMGEVISDDSLQNIYNRKVDVIFTRPNDMLSRLHVETNVKNICCSDMDINELNVGDVLPLNKVLFSLGVTNIPDSAKEQLNQLAKFLLDNPTLEIRIEGHICMCSSGFGAYVPDTGYSSKSLKRAEAVALYLISKGVNKKRVPIIALGEEHPFIWPERTEADEALNRRVAIRIISK